MNATELASLRGWIHLTTLPGIGGETQRKLLQAFGLPEQIFAASRTALRAVIGDKADLLLDTPDEARIAQTLAWAEAPGNVLLALDDARYPQSLLDIPDPPSLLYVRGDLGKLQHPTVAIVGSRHPTPSGKQTARAFAQALGQAGLLVVSGLALGIDAAAHEGAVNTAGGTLAVIGTGPDRLYPASNRALAESILNNGTLISEFPPGTPALPANFPRRNRIIAGLSRAVLVVEAALESGSLITARLALENGKEVMAIPGSIHSPVAKGCHRLIKQGAKLVETVEDILEEIGHRPCLPIAHPETTAKQGKPDAGLAALLDHVEWTPTLLDDIVSRSGQPVSTVLAGLLELELQGLVMPAGGDRYQRSAM